MKKYLVLLASALILTSCVVDEYNNYRHTSDYLETFTDNLVERTAVSVVGDLEYLLKMGHTDIDTEGFSSFNDETRVSIERVGPNEWTATGNASDLKFTASVSREPKEDGMDVWTFGAFTAEYDEGNGYRATLSTEGVVFDWEQRFNIWSISLEWCLEQSGSYELKTFVNDGSADWCRLTYLQGLIISREDSL